MAQTASEVRVGVSGKVQVAPLGTTAPTGIDATWTGATDLGYVSEDGLTESTSTTMEKIRAWQNRTIVRSVVTEGETTFQLTLIQTNEDILTEVYGLGSGDIASGAFVSDPEVERPHKAWCFDVIDGTNLVRKFIPDGQITEVGDIVYQNGAAIGFQITVMAYYNSAIGGAVKHWYTEIAE